EAEVFLSAGEAAFGLGVDGADVDGATVGLEHEGQLGGECGADFTQLPLTLVDVDDVGLGSTVAAGAGEAGELLQAVRAYLAVLDLLQFPDAVLGRRTGRHLRPSLPLLPPLETDLLLGGDPFERVSDVRVVGGVEVAAVRLLVPLRVVAQAAEDLLERLRVGPHEVRLDDHADGLDVRPLPD